MAKKTAVVVVAGGDAAQALQVLYENEGHHVVATPSTTPKDFLEEMKKKLEEAYDEVRVVATSPMALGTGVYEVRTLHTRYEDRGKTLSVGELVERFREGEVKTIAVVGPEILEELKGVALEDFPLGRRLARAANDPADVLVTRHPGLDEFLREKGVVKEDAPTIPHASPKDVEGKVVAGILPPALAEVAEGVVSVPPLGTGRERELTKEEVGALLEEKGYGSNLPRYVLLNMEDPRVMIDLVLLRQEAKEKGLERLERFTEELSSHRLSPELSETLKSLSRGALQEFLYYQMDAVETGKPPRPSSAEVKMEEFLRELMEKEENLTVGDLYKARELSDKVYVAAKLDGASDSAATYFARTADPLYRLQNLLQRGTPSPEFEV